MLDLDAPLHRLVSQLQARLAVLPEPDAPEPEPFPDTFRDFLPRCYVPHIDERNEEGVVPVCAWPLAASQVAVVEGTGVIDLDATSPTTGTAIVGKGRRMFVTALCFLWILFCMRRWDGTRYTTFHQDAERETIQEALDQVRFIVDRLPAEWAAEFKIVGAVVHWGNSRWGHRTGGHSENVASKQGIGGRREGVHYTEVSKMAQASALVTVTAELARGGWLLAESTPNPNGGFFNEQVRLGQAGVGSFADVVWLPWYRAAHNRVARGSQDYARVMNTEFDAQLGAEDRAAESDLREFHGCDDEQIAFRRLKRCTGDSETRRRRRAEYPETIDDAEAPKGDSYWDADAIAACYAMTRAPVDRERLGASHSVSWWVDPAEYQASGRRVVLGVDVSSGTGRDNSAVEVLDLDTAEQIAEVAGKCLASDLAQSIAYVLGCLVDGNAARYVLVVERNRAGAVLKECIKLGLALVCEIPATGGTGKRPGVVTTGDRRDQ